MKEQLIQYIVRLGDDSMILGHRLSELCGHGPALEIDMALTNISLDLFGQTRNYFTYAAELEGKGRTEDDFAYKRDIREFGNVLLTEQPNDDFAYVIARQFFFDSYHLPFLERLKNSKDERLAAIAAKSFKEVSYHLRFSTEWMKRLGGGTDESHSRLQTAVTDLWDYVGEMWQETDLDKELNQAGFAPDLKEVAKEAKAHIQDVLAEANIQAPDSTWSHSGGKKGIHSEHMGFILSDFQWMQRTYPNMEW